MAKLAYMLALVQATLISGRPGAYEQKRHAKFHDKRMIELSSSLDITTSYSSAIVSSLQSATITVSPSITAVRNAPHTPN
jgi:endo-1,3(4)-beta-glucanase